MRGLVQEVVDGLALVVHNCWILPLVREIEIMTKAAAIFAIALTLGLGVAFVATSLTGPAWGQQDQKP